MTALQRELFSITYRNSLHKLELPVPHQAHSPTSAAAATAIEHKLPALQQAVLTEIRARKLQGATDEELQIQLGMNPSTERPRRIELLRAGLIDDSGRTRKTTSGRSAVVWVAI